MADFGGNPHDSLYLNSHPMYFNTMYHEQLPSWQALRGVQSHTMQPRSPHSRYLSFFQHAPANTGPEISPSHQHHPRAGRVNVVQDSVQTFPLTARRVDRQESLYPQLRDENHGNSIRPTEQNAQSGDTDQQELQKPSASAAQPVRYREREPLTDITASAVNNALQPPYAMPNVPAAQTNGTNRPARPIPTRTMRQAPPYGEQAYLKPYKTMGVARFAGNGQLAEYSSLLLTHPRVVQAWQNNPLYTEEQISRLLQWYVQVSQATSPKTVYEIMEKRSLGQSRWHKLDHRVYHSSNGGIPPIGSVIPNQPVADTSVGQVQPDFADGGQAFEFLHYPRSWEQLPIGTTLSDILNTYPNHIKDEHLDAFAAHGISGSKMWNLIPHHLKNLFKSTYLVKTSDETNLFYKRMSQRKNMVVTRYGGIAYNTMVSSPVHLRDVGTSVRKQNASLVSTGFLAHPEDWLDYRHGQFSAPNIVRTNEATYKRDKAAAKKEAARAKKSNHQAEQARLSAVDSRSGPAGTLTKKRRHVDDDDFDEERMPKNDFAAPQKRQKADHGMTFPGGQSSLPRQCGFHHQPAFIPIQPRIELPTTSDANQFSERFSASCFGSVGAPVNVGRPQFTPQNVMPHLQAPSAKPFSSPQPGQKRGRDDADDQLIQSMTEESTIPAEFGKFGQREEETLNHQGAHAWSNWGMDNQVADHGQPDYFVNMLEADSPDIDWDSILNPGSVPEVTESLPLGSDDQHTNGDIGGQEPNPMTEDVDDFIESITDYQKYSESAAPSDNSSHLMAQGHISAAFQQSQLAGSSPGPSKTSKRGRDEFEEDSQNLQEPSVARPLKKLKQTGATLTEDTADNALVNQDFHSLVGGGNGVAGRVPEL